MKLKPVKLAPALIALFVVVFVCILRIIKPDVLARLERMTYDIRVRQAMRFPAPIASNLGFLAIDDASIDFVRTNSTLGYRFGLLWPRQVYGRAVEELDAQGAKAIAFDVILGELREDQWPVRLNDGRTVDSDVFFAQQMARAGNVILADTRTVTPPPLFETNAFALGDIATDGSKDTDGVLRRAQAFRIRRKWHPLFQQVEAEYGFDLSRARVDPGQIVLPRADGDVKVPLNTNGEFALADFVGDKIPTNMAPTAKPFTDERIWHMGILLAARELGLDLSRAQVDLPNGRITLRGTNGVERVLPVDHEGRFYIDWRITASDPQLETEPIWKLLQQDTWRLEGKENLQNVWSNKLVVVGSTATGNNLTDVGATPLESNTFLASEHWNVANSVIAGEFIRRSSLGLDLILIAILGAAAGWLTWQWRALLATLSVALLAVGYIAIADYAYIAHRFWLPLFLPIVGALAVTHVCLITWRVVFEQAEHRRVKNVFSKIVSPNIVNELLQAEKLALGGARREVTVLFADVRGFTEFTDRKQEQAAEYIATHKLSDAEIEAYHNEQARETLDTVNTYLAMLADIVKEHDGTLDKYIGDCVMAFWGAPTPNSKHAVCCVRAAIAAQRTFYELNRKRAEQNKALELENLTRAAAGLPPKPLLPILLLGSGINTGLVTVGLMGSDAHIYNYTVFGREVNVASRLESVSGRGRIVISEATYQDVLRDDPELAATCISLTAEKVKGIRTAVKIYEVPWRPPGSPSLDEELFARKPGDTSTALLQRDKT